MTAADRNHLLNLVISQSTWLYAEMTYLPAESEWKSNCLKRNIICLLFFIDRHSTVVDVLKLAVFIEGVDWSVCACCTGIICGPRVKRQRISQNGERRRNRTKYVVTVYDSCGINLASTLVQAVV